MTDTPSSFYKELLPDSNKISKFGVLLCLFMSY